MGIKATLLTGRDNLMELMPPLKTVLRTAAEPGELVRIRWAESSVLGLATRDRRQHSGVVTLASGSVPTMSQTAPDSTDYILSYGRGYAVYPSSDGRFAKASESGFEVPGALCVTPERVLIYVLLNGLDYCFYDIATGEVVVGDPIEKCWAALDWEIRLNSARIDAPTIFSFSAP
jgi:hypothetical protein